MIDTLAEISPLVRRLLSDRGAYATICPSEVARATVAASDGRCGTDDWREAMPRVHAAIDLLVANGEIHLSWKGIRMASRAGPYRIGSAHVDTKINKSLDQQPIVSPIK